MAKWNHLIVVGSDRVVVSYNSEAADWGNPRGEVWGERWFVSTSDGAREYVHEVAFRTEDEAYRLRDRVRAAAAKGWSPVGNQHWTARTIYGGTAWGKSDEHESQRLDVEAEFGPGSYGPSHAGFLG